MKENEKIRLVRKTLEMTQQELAEILNVSKQYLSKVENGLTSLSREKITFLCERFDVSTDWLLLDKGEMFTANKQSEEYITDRITDFITENLHLELFCKYIEASRFIINSKYPGALFTDVMTIALHIFVLDYSSNRHPYEYWEKALRSFEKETRYSKLFAQKILKEYKKMFV